MKILTIPSYCNIYLISHLQSGCMEGRKHFSVTIAAFLSYDCDTMIACDGKIGKWVKMMVIKSYEEESKR